ncbi:MAG: TolC family protein [Rikenellaceae bacterium]|nr:TolC family protein [Rikenellaceae bacterium]
MNIMNLTRRLLTLTLTASLALCCLCVSAQDKTLLTLEEALEIALSENPTIKIADKEIEKTGYAKKGTYAALYPQIDASAAYQRTIKKQVMYFGDSGQGMEVGMNNSWNGGFNLSMPVVNVGLWKSLKISAMDVELAVEKARSSRIDMIEQVSNAFYAVLLATDNHKVYKDIYDNATVNLANVKQKFDVGKVSEYDLISAEVTVKNAEPNVYEAENNLRIAHWQLKALMGVALDMEIECAGNLKEYESAMDASIDNLSLKDNSTMAQFEIQRRQLEKMVEVTKASNYPTLNLSGNLQWSAMDNTYKFSKYRWTPYSVAGLSLNIPIFAGGKRRFDLKQAKANVETLELQRIDTERSLNVEVLRQASLMQTSVRQLEAARSNVDQAQRGYDIAVKRYEVGGGTLLEINDSQLALSRAMLTFNQSIYNYMVARNALDRLQGKNITE